MKYKYSLIHIVKIHQLGLRDWIYILYSIEIIISMESPHKTWNTNVCVCVLNVFVNILRSVYVRAGRK